MKLSAFRNDKNFISFSLDLDCAKSVDKNIIKVVVSLKVLITFISELQILIMKSKPRPNHATIFATHAVGYNKVGK